ncbi:MAG TPA: DNA glycosylase [Candidatus Acidoferrum sp.]|nr:DNA glycosylase [Candidatus Acidoferrum sp.]
MKTNKYTVQLAPFNLWQVLLSGQCFRSAPDGEGALICAGGHRGRFSCAPDGLVCEVESFEALETFWLPYFDAGRDYMAARSYLSQTDPVMEAATRAGSGLRVLRQPLFETVLTFIISQRSNIPRIKRVVAELCGRYGQDMGGWHAFPTPERLACVPADELACLRAGYRTPYIAAAARFAAEGGLEGIGSLPYAEAKARLLGMPGIGEKVACCILLFAGGYMEAFPVDVWIGRAIDELYGGCLDPCTFAPYAGLAQQYLFYHIRQLNGAPGPEEYLRKL